MRKIDYSDVPEKYHILFETDWDYGSDSQMKLQDRINCHELYLDYCKWRTRELINRAVENRDENIIQGFVKD